MGKGKGQIKSFDLNTSLSKKEGRKMGKMNAMIPYHLARCPFYNGKESEHYAAAEKLKEDIVNLEKKAYLRWQEQNGIF
eukprot:CAMPEP_0183355142 /NCGR_PEP_ID=MMETSP0164_2-20130417/39329_1 /TAXON_ID=221442 /ORGANISM="Coccolithus pelagicus ssp braarudi, Strain PLY182g" /LENGTH=78 /DNA_ID=CAMNT_0025528165 /DNA_START=57 /DNA_END=293 /DNA_ORIENTATION=+